MYKKLTVAVLIGIAMALGGCASMQGNNPDNSLLVIMTERSSLQKQD